MDKSKPLNTATEPDFYWNYCDKTDILWVGINTTKHSIPDVNLSKYYDYYVLSTNTLDILNRLYSVTSCSPQHLTTIDPSGKSITINGQKTHIKGVVEFIRYLLCANNSKEEFPHKYKFEEKLLFST